MGTTTFKDAKIYNDVKPWHINRTNINSREDKYQDAVLANLEKENIEKPVPKKKSKKEKKKK